MAKTKEERAKLPNFEVIDGGKDTTVDEEGPWIEKLDIGDVFLVKENILGPSDYVMQGFELISKEYLHSKLVGCLLETIYTPSDLVFPIEPKRFCRRYSLVKILSNTKYY